MYTFLFLPRGHLKINVHVLLAYGRVKLNRRLKPEPLTCQAKPKRESDRALALVLSAVTCMRCMARGCIGVDAYWVMAV
jgi:hypothetical protein